eukprot:2244974-Rhodomonas_salina.2
MAQNTLILLCCTEHPPLLRSTSRLRHRKSALSASLAVISALPSPAPSPCKSPNPSTHLQVQILNLSLGRVLAGQDWVQNSSATLLDLGSTTISSNQPIFLKFAVIGSQVREQFALRLACFRSRIARAYRQTILRLLSAKVQPHKYSEKSCPLV